MTYSKAKSLTTVCMNRYLSIMLFKYLLSIIVVAIFFIGCGPEDSLEEINETNEPNLIAEDTLYLTSFWREDLFAGGPPLGISPDETNTDTIFTYEGFIYFVNQDFLGEIIIETDILGEVISRRLQMPEVITYLNITLPSEMEMDIEFNSTLNRLFLNKVFPGQSSYYIYYDDDI